MTRQSVLAIGAASAYTSEITGNGPHGSRRRWLRAALRSRLLQRESKVGAQHPNSFLASLPAKDFELLRPHLKPFDMVHEDLLFDTGETLNWAYLPHSGVISLVVGLADGRLIEAAMVGRDSIVGGSAALDGKIALNRGIVQVEGLRRSLMSTRCARSPTKAPPSAPR